MPVVENKIFADTFSGTEMMVLSPFESPCTSFSLDYEIIVKIFRLVFSLKRELPHVGADEVHLDGFTRVSASQSRDRTAQVNAFSPVGVVIDVERNFHELIF